MQAIIYNTKACPFFSLFVPFWSNDYPRSQADIDMELFKNHPFFDSLLLLLYNEKTGKLSPTGSNLLFVMRYAFYLKFASMD